MFKRFKKDDNPFAKYSESKESEKPFVKVKESYKESKNPFAKYSEVKESVTPFQKTKEPEKSFEEPEKPAKKVIVKEFETPTSDCWKKKGYWLEYSEERGGDLVILDKHGSIDVDEETGEEKVKGEIGSIDYSELEDFMVDNEIEFVDLDKPHPKILNWISERTGICKSTHKSF